MKADHRKELHTNLLADRMGRLMQGVKSGSRPKSAIVWFIGGLAVVTFIGWYIANYVGASSGGAWINLNNNENSPLTLEAISQANPGTMVARQARFQRARLLLRSGLSSIYSNVGVLPSIDAHDQAQSSSVQSLKDARKLFQELIHECADDSILQQEALLSAAKAEETLVGVPKGDTSEEAVGNLDDALQLYRRLAEKYPTSEFGKQAAARVKELTDSRAEVEDFYRDFRISSQKPSQLKGSFAP